jgi:UDP-glucose 6-dehydrogenase
MCLPKDTKALDALVKQLGLDLKLFETIDQDNQKFKRTVFPGMRP